MSINVSSAIDDYSNPTVLIPTLSFLDEKTLNILTRTCKSWSATIKVELNNRNQQAESRYPIPMSSFFRDLGIPISTFRETSWDAPHILPFAREDQDVYLDVQCTVQDRKNNNVIIWTTLNSFKYMHDSEASLPRDCITKMLLFPSEASIIHGHSKYPWIEKTIFSLLTGQHPFYEIVGYRPIPNTPVMQNVEAEANDPTISSDLSTKADEAEQAVQSKLLSKRRMIQLKAFAITAFTFIANWTLRK